MTQQEIEQTTRRLEGERKRKGVFYVALSVVILLLTLGLAYTMESIDDQHDALQEQREDFQRRDQKIAALENALDAQREQFEACKDKPLGTPGCMAPVTPPSGAIPGPKGDPGIQGIPGIQGPVGPIGPVGPQGNTGPQGNRGPQGEKGEPGAQGPAGEVGATGEQGPAGPMGPAGPVGPPGPQGERGPAGTDAPVITSMQFVGGAEGCSLVVGFNRGENLSIPVPRQFCLGV